MIPLMRPNVSDLCRLRGPGRVAGNQAREKAEESFELVALRHSGVDRQKESYPPTQNPHK